MCACFVLWEYDVEDLFLLLVCVCVCVAVQGLRMPHRCCLQILYSRTKHTQLCHAARPPMWWRGKVVLSRSTDSLRKRQAEGGRGC